MQPDETHNEEDTEFTNILERFQKAMVAHNPEDVANATENVFALMEQRHLERKQSTQDLMSEEAMELEAAGDWAGAEATYRKILDLPGIDVPKVWEIHSKLASLLRLVGHPSEAIAHARIATATARKLDLVSAQVMAIQSESRLLLEMGLPETAMPLLEEALDLVNQDAIFEGMRPGLLVQRAKCNLTMGDMTQQTRATVQKDLDLAFAQMAPMADAKIVTGIQATLADYWFAMSMLHFQTHSPDLALESVQKTLTLWEEIHEQPHSRGVFTLFSVSDALSKVSDAMLKCGRDAEAAQMKARCLQIRHGLKLPTSNPGKPLNG